MGFIHKHKKSLIVSFVSIVILIILGLYLQSQSLKAMPKDGESITLKVKLENTELVKNDYVGNDWDLVANVDGHDIKKGQTIEIKATKYTNIRLNAIAAEKDTIPDIGRSSRTVNFMDPGFKLSEKNIISTEVYVTENRGAYSGNEAIWRFTFTVERKGLLF